MTIKDIIHAELTEMERKRAFLRYVQGLPKDEIEHILNGDFQDIDVWGDLVEKLSEVLRI